jgi:flagellar hook-associated protein 3 FlgL
LSTKIGGALQQLDQADTHLQNVRAGIGARLSLLDDASSTRDAINVDVQTALSNLQDLDYATAITKLQQQMVGLQAAQQSYMKISQLSLFSYL